MRRLPVLLAVFAAVLAAGLPARGDKPVPPPAAPPVFDDDEVLERFVEKVGGLAKAKKCISPEKLRKITAEDGKAAVVPVAPKAARVDPEDVYRAALPGVFLLGSVTPDPDAPGEYRDGRLGTAWAMTADGVLVTNWHLFEDIAADESFGVTDHAGNAYPITDVFAVDQKADVAIVKVAAKGLTPLPLAEKPAPVGAWVGVLGHPGGRHFFFSQGAVGRYQKVRYEDGTIEKWMAVTADYAYGSSGSPVLDRTGAVVGMATLTENLDYPEPEPADEKPKEKEADAKKSARRRALRRADEPKPANAGSALQMVVKLTVPAAEIRRVAGAE
ncbi:MAG: S1 family peptidase [Fimbriiglobus sp.]